MSLLSLHRSLSSYTSGFLVFRRPSHTRMHSCTFVFTRLWRSAPLLLVTGGVGGERATSVFWRRNRTGEVRKLECEQSEWRTKRTHRHPKMLESERYFSLLRRGTLPVSLARSANKVPTAPV
ncbi:UNVERIFIED_CONTAM: hypothetical protein HHA_214100 [Hammondia hammondi]|eukprot:XP_008885390.1 hypothetical protein HHA_214100 [Hammondia hammondi]